MSQLTERYRAETGKEGAVIKYSRLYYSAYYVNWLEKLVEGVQNQSGEAPVQQPKVESVPPCNECLNDPDYEDFNASVCDDCREET